MSTDESTDADPKADAGGRPTAAALEAIDDGLVDLLAWLLDTETRARIYLYLRMVPGRTSDEVARGTGLYPSTVRECLAAMHDEGLVSREKRASEGAGNNPFEYTAIPPRELVGDLVSQIQDQLNTVCNLDHHLDDAAFDGGSAVVRIEVAEADPGDD